VVLVLVAVAVRAAFLIGDPHPDNLAGLTLAEGEVARVIVDEGEWFRTDVGVTEAIRKRQIATAQLVDFEDVDVAAVETGVRDPHLIVPLGPSLILAATWKVTGSQRYIWLQLVQFAVGVALTLVVAWLALRLFARARAAVIAGALWAISPGIAYYASIPLYEIWAVYWTVGIVAFYVWASDRGFTWKTLVALGLLIAAGSLFRQGLLLLLPALALAQVRVSPRAAVRALAIMAAACAVGLIPWTARNIGEFDAVRPVNGVFGQVLWEALGDGSDAFGATYDDGVTFDEVHAERPELVYGTPEYDDYLRAKAFDAIADHPADYAKLVVNRFEDSTLGNTAGVPVPTVQLPGPSAIADRLDQLLTRVLAQMVHFDRVLFVIALASAIWLWLTAVARNRDAVLLLGAVYASVLVTPVFISSHDWRYVAPAMFVLYILAAVGLDEAWERGRDRLRRFRDERADAPAADTAA
jgi:4-amino-4-deoxy-L-arabinose transferase-like glycosyltransferase